MIRPIFNGILTVAIFAWPVWFFAATGHIAAVGILIFFACIAFLISPLNGRGE